ncbi:hypothetical protein [Streptomyces sp. NPDC059639]|uniref:hypothetical protein n=1 Tax=Streptomyces sp. NPDC059639 TaxID=3346891 RepID=UPI0036B32885
MAGGIVTAAGGETSTLLLGGLRAIGLHARLWRQQDTISGLERDDRVVMASRHQPSGPPSTSGHEEAVQDVIVCFEVFARTRTARESLLSSHHVDPREEQRAFANLHLRVRPISGNGPGPAGL